MHAAVEYDIPAEGVDLDETSLELLGASDDPTFLRIVERIVPTYTGVERVKVTAFNSRSGF